MVQMRSSKGESRSKEEHMKSKAKTFTNLNYIFAGGMWLLGILTLLFNILGLWAPWHLAGFGWLFSIPVVAVFQLFAILFSLDEKNKKLFLINLLSLVISIAVALFTYHVSTTWFW